MFGHRSCWSGGFTWEISIFLNLWPPGAKTITICAIDTPKGSSWQMWIGGENVPPPLLPTHQSVLTPEIDEQVLSSSNNRAEMPEKRQIYYDTEALEVWRILNPAASGTECHPSGSPDWPRS